MSGKTANGGKFRSLSDPERSLLLLGLERAIDAYEQDILVAKGFPNVVKSYTDKKNMLQELVKRLENANIIGYLEKRK